MSEESIRSRIRDFIRQRMVEYGGDVDFSDDTSLLVSGQLDSLAVLYIIMFMEQEFAIEFSTFEFDPDRFDTVNSMADIVAELGDC